MVLEKTGNIDAVSKGCTSPFAPIWIKEIVAGTVEQSCRFATASIDTPSIATAPLVGTEAMFSKPDHYSAVTSWPPAASPRRVAGGDFAGEPCS